MKFIPLAQCIKKTVAILTTSLYLAQISVVFAAVPVLIQVTPVGSTGDTTPNYVFSSDQAGTITYGGSCSSTTTSVFPGNNIITLKPTIGQFFAPGTYNNCSLTVTNGSNESTSLNISSFTIDTSIPVISQVTPVPSMTSNVNPTYTFTSNEAGTITYSGACTSTTTMATTNNNVITLKPTGNASFADGIYNNCSLTVTDTAGNVSTPLNINSFTVDGTGPVIAEITPIAVTTPNTQPTYTFSSTKGGTITY